MSGRRDGGGGPAGDGGPGGAEGAIVGAERRPYRLRLAGPYRSARGERTDRRGWLLRLESRDGTVGWGEAAPLPGRTESVEAAGRALERAAAAAGGEPAASGPDLRSALPDGAPAAAHALGLALADLAARHGGRPLAEGWAGEAGRDGGPRERVPVNATLPMADPEATAARAEEAVGRGIRCLKLKVGGPPTEDLHRLAAVRRAVGPGPALRLDANAAWSRREARSRLLRMEPYGIDYVEQPLDADDLEGLGRLRSESGADVRIAADESATSLERVRRLAGRGLVDVVVLKPTVLGPPRRTLQAAEAARAGGTEVVLTTALGAAVERLGALHLAASVPGRLPPSGLATRELLAEDVADAPDRVEDGTIPVPLDRPGLGAAPVRSP